MNDPGLQSTDSTGVLTGNTDLDWRAYAWTPSDTGTERVPQAVDFPMAEAFKDYER